ncbi:AAA family ATPase [Roseibium sp. CAU 1637]|uniref:AAA family ATPase n=1 Tax=Roseibium limicola TaxID=2816037 RepID=A0A939JAA5_9HYPH|nr:AAA family ATPase [Roseibium limicola]MBO0346238.1 AAA family ATPase [Roseibium limicola]
MKLRKLTLHNVRRFTGRTAALGPFGDGLTTITAENESGKSTFFDALHALFFHDYGSGKKELKDLQPYAGGAMRIAAEVEIEGEAYRIEKVFNLKKAGSSATITSLATGTILKQADDAEQWIQQTILNTNKGPAGLLWVRQGTTGLDNDPKAGAKAEAEGIEARRDIMSSIRGQIDAVTGGRRMDKIVQHCKQELDLISTKQDKPKAGSQWKAAEDHAESLRDLQQVLTTTVATLRRHLDDKKRASRRLRELNDPELRQERADAVTQTEAKRSEAREHDKHVQSAKKDLQILTIEQAEFEREIEQIHQAQKQRANLADAIKAKHAQVEIATQEKAKAGEALKSAQAKIAQMEVERRDLKGARELAKRAEGEAAGRLQLFAHWERKQQLREPTEQLDAASSVLKGIAITPEDVERLAKLETRRDIAIEKRKFHFSSFVLHADQSKALIDGKEVPNGEQQTLDRAMDVALPGFGSISLRPAEGAGLALESPAELQEELNDSLKALGVSSMEAARQVHEARKRALQAQQIAQAQVRALAPDGLQALENQWQSLCKELNHAAEEPAPAVPNNRQADTQDGAGPSSEAIEAAISELEDDIERQRLTLPALETALAKAADVLTEAEVLLRRLRDEAAELAVPADEAERLSQLQAARQEQTIKVTEAQAVLQALQAGAPDIAASEAAYDRAQSAVSEDTREIHSLEKVLAVSNAFIQTHSEEAVEERLAEVTGELSRAEERAAQFADHAKALKLLIQHLEAARADAQDTYFEPIRKELIPLLSQLHAGADFEIDPEKLAVGGITRNGVSDSVDALSGGASEQIALLTRLAFARLFAKQGNHVPIILDDAMVHTDDERISKMFDVLTHVAKDQQIIVLSCRTRAFSALGGARASIEEAPEAG